MALNVINLLDPMATQEFMHASTNIEDWISRCEAVKAAHKGTYSEWWYKAIGYSELATERFEHFRLQQQPQEDKQV